MLGKQLQRTASVVARLLHVAGTEMEPREPPRSMHRERVQLRGPPQGRDRFRESAQRREQVALRANRVGIAGVEREGPGEVGFFSPPLRGLLEGRTTAPRAT